MNTIIALWLGTMDPSDGDVEALIRGTRVALSAEDAAENITDARIAGALVGVDPNVLLAIAWHESRFQARTITREPGHRVSCGVMTPEPKARCLPEELTLMGGYMAGARHLRRYLDREGSLSHALVAYAGGHGSVAHPAAGWRAWRARGEFLRMRGAIRARSQP